MLWNLVVNRYERYHLSHIFMLFVLALYSIIGAILFCSLEAPNELRNLRKKVEIASKKSGQARDKLLYDLRSFFDKEINVSRLLSKELDTTLNYYDSLMGFDSEDLTDVKRQAKWTIWGGLYFAGTVYTTIGYGDLVTETVAGKLFTVLYALIGIPLVITVLNIWGGGLFQLMQSLEMLFLLMAKEKQLLVLWCDYIRRLIRRFSSSSTESGNTPKFDIENEERQFIMNQANSDSQTSDERRLEEEESSKLPLRMAIVVLLIWICVCATIFCLFQNWNFFDAAYFFFISLTTIGLSDAAVEHKVICMYFMLILIGLSVVSMSISVIQVQIEGIFAKVVKSIDNDFKRNLAAEKRKHSMATSVGEERKISANTIAISVPHQKLINVDEEDEDQDHDALRKYGKNMAPTEKLLIRLMSNHQRHMLNQKMKERQQMRTIGVQTEERKITSAAQTDQITKIGALQSFNQVQYEESTSSSEEEEATIGSSRRTLSKSQAQFGNRRPGTGSAVAPNASTPRHNRPRGLSRKKLYIYNIGD